MMKLELFEGSNSESIKGKDLSHLKETILGQSKSKDKGYFEGMINKVSLD